MVGYCNGNETEYNGKHFVGHQLLPVLELSYVDDQNRKGVNCLEEELRTGFCSGFNTA